MRSLLSKEKLIELFFKYPVAYYSIFFLYATRSQFYMINNISIYDSVIHNLLIFWGMMIIFYYVVFNKKVFNSNKKFVFLWIISSVMTIGVNIYQIRFDSIRSSILTIIVILTFLPAYSTLKGKYDNSRIFKLVFYPTICFKFINSLISLTMYFLNISIFVISDLSNLYTYGIRYVSIGNNAYNLLLYGNFFSPNKEVMQAVPLMMIASYIVFNKKIWINKLEKIMLIIFMIVEFIVISLCNSRGALYSIIIVFIMYLFLLLFKKNRGEKCVTTKNIIMLIIAICVILLGYSGVKKTAAIVVSKVNYTRYIYDYNNGNILKLNEEEVRNKYKYQKYIGKIFEYNPVGIKDETGYELKEKILIGKEDSGDELGNGRISIWKETLKLYMKKPFLGIGQGMNTEFASKFNLSDFPILNKGVAVHNSYLALLLYQGITGLLIVLIWLFRLLIKFIKFEVKYNRIDFSIMHINLYFILIVSLFLDVIFIRDEFTQLMMLFTIGYLTYIKENLYE